jgi:hypothetical protein
MPYYLLLRKGSLGGRQGLVGITELDVAVLNMHEGIPPCIPAFRSLDAARTFAKECNVIEQCVEEYPMKMPRAVLAAIAGALRGKGLADVILFDPYLTSAGSLKITSKPLPIERFCRRAKTLTRDDTP